MEVEKTVNETLHSKELNSISTIATYEFKVLNPEKVAKSTVRDFLLFDHIVKYKNTTQMLI